VASVTFEGAADRPRRPVGAAYRCRGAARECLDRQAGRSGVSPGFPAGLPPARCCDAAQVAATSPLQVRM